MRAFEEARGGGSGYITEGLFAGDGEVKQMEQRKQQQQQAARSSSGRPTAVASIPPPRSIADPAGAGGWGADRRPSSGVDVTSPSFHLDQEEQWRQIR